MKKELIILAAAIIACGSLQAQAAKWGGPYAGISVGSTELKTNWKNLDGDWGGLSWDGSRYGITYGLHGGYNFQTGPLVLGGEASYSFASLNRSARMADTPDPGGESTWSSSLVVRTDNVKSILTVKGKVGLEVDTALLYLTAGASRLSIDHTWAEDADPNDSWSFKTAKTVAVYGAGLAFKVTPKVSANLEFLTSRKAETTGTNPGGYVMRTTDRVQTLQGGVTYHF